jgi:hypothetical protein
MISVSIDEEAQVAYDSIPRGQRSLRIRDVLKEAAALSTCRSIVADMEDEVTELSRRLGRAELDLQNYKLGMVEAGWISPEHQRESKRGDGE